MSEPMDDVTDASLFKEEPIDDEIDIQGNCEILTVCEVHKLMEAEISKVQSIVELPKHVLRVNLSAIKWDTDAYLEKFYDERIQAESQVKVIEVVRNQPRQLRSARVQKRKLTNAEGAPPLKVARQELQCEICFESDLSAKELYDMQCQHVICRACFKTYLNTTINENAPIDFIACPGFNCKNPVPDDFVYEQLEPTLTLKFRKLTTNAFVLNNRLIKWCISPNCSRAIKVTLENQAAVECECGARFCFNCSEVEHSLIPCNLMRRYRAVKEANLETANWIALSSKQCPQCNVDIEKNAGCNHMRCLKCGCQFCWFCMAKWNDHHGCKPSVPENLKTSDLRWLSACNTKYQTVVQSIKLDEKMYKTKLRNQELASEEKWLKADFVKDAVDILLLSRQTLADSFVLEYFYENNKNLPSYALFQMNKNSLQRSTENLSRLLEDAFVTFFESYNDLKPRVTYAAKYCKDLSKVVHEIVKDGLHGGDWKLLL